MMAMAFTNVGEYTRALATLDDGLKSAEKTDIPYWVPRMHNVRGWIHQELCDWQGALEWDKEALRAGRESGQIEVEGNTLVNLATDYRLLGDHSQSRQCLEVAGETVNRQDWCSFRCRTRWLWEWGQLSLAQGDIERARQYAEEMLQIAVSTGQVKNMAKGSKLKGETLAVAGELDEAVRELERAHDTAEAIGQRNLAWQIGYSLAQLRERQGQYTEAKALYEQAMRTIQRITSEIGDPELRHAFTRARMVQAVHDALAKPGVSG
jgi:tetratricopeptide (TPR) repeat protein